MVYPVLDPPPKKPASKGRLLSISTHVDECVINNAAGTHGATLGLDILSRVGQSISSFEAPQWQFLNNARDCNTLYDKSVELIAASFAAVAQLNYKLYNEVHSSMSYAQESKNLQLKLTDEYKAAKAKMEAETEQMKARIVELEKFNVKLEEEKKATFEIMEGEKARLLAVDLAMYRIWASNADLDTSFLGSFEEELVAKWQAWLDAEEATREEAARAKEDAEKAKEDAHSS
ncbi:uncharacterized protein LOC133801954 [Humulus lupulus]|uniref:uncharacterized protein LOC133801954 n=1 Tax=Humulus lupulus TaxID=3486 RepID=UPI002B403884|nr:uncharacterized protein LOC133801954 [Humulus lupulus]